MYDVIIRDGILVDPETGLEKRGDVAIRSGTIERVGAVSGAAVREIDAAGQVVAPGFIDIHAHGQSIPADRMQAFDGVTTTLECEVGILPVAKWYEKQADVGRVLNYGAAAAWAFARISAIIERPLEPSLSFMGKCFDDPRWSQNTASDSESRKILALVERGLEEGGVGIGIPNAYLPGAGAKEIVDVCSLAARYDVPTYTHIAYSSNIDPRSSIDAYTRLIGYAGATGAHMHICHFNSTSLQDVERAAELVLMAQKQGLKVTVEAYPYGTGSTVIGAPFFADPAFRERTGNDYPAIQKVENGQRISSRDELLAAQQERPDTLVLWHFLDVEGVPRHRELLDTSVLYPGGIIASDAMPWTLPDGSTYEGGEWPLPAEASSHPRSSGTFTKFLREYMRERKKVSLLEAMRRCSLGPAKIIESAAPQMRRKGRLQEGCDADIVIFDPDTIADKAEFSAMNRRSEGVSFLLVNGEPVIDGGELRVDAAPGRPVRGRLGRR
ncbi:D-glutamate deacylase [Acetobacter nitrogenifigens DSM 23921 = NBRC 105050]|uniref:D-glutamate deacylase n=1 Tax=Acetobacter nitrogenifigens DSM 23921 = NBRC 105050 TaxID=1120919 RepID=A0A511XD51_9PROT|nr:amidohydrolase family protein [Acetobacter nitrogenifigens]GBQ91661.1 D-glutamate deacylase [Acetobacter nitrogenifigens DSM 23921 = NBRC 105050]GEN60805.1 D-glutamate deacylase [Acetobacter nitrogenifigens DSM 23921 = NBRC 105050]